MTVKVIHSAPVWLPQTQTWVHTQVDCVPADRIENHVVCERVVNLDQFPVRHLHQFTDESGWHRFWDRALRRLRFRRHLGFLARTAQGIGASVIHSHFGDVGWADIGAARAAGARHVVTFYGYDMSTLPRQTLWRERFHELFSKVDMVLCEGPHMGTCLTEIGCPKSKVRVHHLGVRLDRLAFRPRQWRPGTPLRVLVASAFAEKKGIPYAIDALGRLSRDVELEVTLVGEAHHGSAEALAERARILAAIARNKLGANIRMTGFLSHAALIREAYDHHLYLAPSVTAADGGTEGGAPVSLIEMAATGMLVVSSRHCDIPSVIVEGKGGFLAEERDVEGLAESLRKAIAETGSWPGILAFTRKHIESEFDSENQGLRLAGIYEELACA